MRVVAGQYKGRKIQIAKGVDLRPTTERVRAAIFSALSSFRELAGVSVLDLFSGSGALGLEALSRGARSCTFVEKDRRNVESLRATLAELALTDRCEIVTGDVFRYLEGRKSANAPGSSEQPGYDLVFADPPYEGFDSHLFIELLADSTLLKASSTLVLETNNASMPAELPSRANLCPYLLKAKNYGDTKVSYVQFK